MHAYFMCTLTNETKSLLHFSYKLKLLNWFHVHNTGLCNDQAAVLIIIIMLGDDLRLW